MKENSRKIKFETEHRSAIQREKTETEEERNEKGDHQPY